MPSALPPAEAPGAHTSGAQWQSFELRMRQRRIDRLLARADAAIAARRPEDALEPLEELEILDPKSPKVAELRARANAPASEPPAVDLELRPPDAIPREPPAARRWPWVAAAMLAIGVGAWLTASGVRIPDALRDAISPAAAPSVPVTTAVEEVAATSLPPVRVAVDEVPATGAIAEPPGINPIDGAPVATADQLPVSLPPVEARGAMKSGTDSVRTRTAPAQPRTEPEPQRIELPRPLATESRARLESTPTRTEPPPTRPEPPATRPEPPPARPEPTTGRLDPASVAPPALPEVTSSLPPRTAPERSIAPPPAATTAAPSPIPATSGGETEPPPRAPAAPPRPLAADESGVRSTLAQYESAYSRLDVEAAGAVWPGLDRRALARAFDGLSAQRIDLGSCDVRIVAETAMAECRGSATWTPKVGGGRHTQRRQWQFRLRQAPGGWHIVGATVR